MSHPQPTPDQAKFALGVSLASFTVEHQTTRRVIDAIPADRGDYRPDGVARTALDLAWHIVASEKRFLTSVAAGVFDTTPMPRPDSITTAAAIGPWFDESFASSVRALQGLSGEQLTKVIDFRGLFQLPAVSFVPLALNHTIHHRGQLSMYLRPMGAKVPSIYGESYDASQARLAKEGKLG